ncbi:MAG: TonB-dependent receptor [Pseudomonadota bacterium]
MSVATFSHHQYRQPADGLRVAVLLIAVLAYTSTVAQETDSEADSNDGLQLDEIVVTGQKVDRTLQETTASVAVFTELKIVEQNFTSIYDALNQTANVAGLFGDRGFSIRGLANSGASPGDQTSDVSAVYLDGAFVPNSLYFGDGLNLWDIGAVEIFRGPQSTIQGRNALAGAIVARTVDPNLEEIDGRVMASLGDYNTWRAAGAMSLPIIEDQVGLRLSVDRTESDGFTDNPFLNSDNIDARENTTIRGKLLIAPNAIEDLEIRLMGTVIDSDIGEDRVILQRFTGARESEQNTIDRDLIEAQQFSAVVDYTLSDNVTFTSVTSFIESERAFQFDPTNDSGGPDNPGISLTDQDTFSQEFRLTFNAERWTGLLGLYAFDSSTEFENEGAAGATIESDPVFPPPPLLATILFNTTTPTPDQIAQAAFLRQQIVTLVPEFPLFSSSATTDEIRNYAVFGEATYDFNERWSLTVGARYDQEQIDQTVFDTLTVPVITTGDPVVDPILAFLSAQFTSEVDLVADNDFDAFLPKVVLNYRWNDDVSTAFSVQRAYRAGGLSFNFFRAQLPIPGGGDPTDQAVLEQAGIVNSFEPEFTWNYEFAFRSQWLDRRLTLNANAFLIDYEDQQINLQLSNNPLDRITENVGASRLFGFEVEATANINEHLEVFANVGFTDTEFTESAISIDEIDLNGNEFAAAPPWTAGFGGRYTTDAGFFVNLRARYADEAFTFVQNTPNVTNDAYVVVDTLIGYEHDSFTVEVFANNLLDENYITQNTFENARDIAVGRVGAPRMVGVRFYADF